jgi:hypothetical protein
MDPKTVEEIFKRLDTLGNKLLEGGVKFGAAMTQGAYAEGTSNLFVGVVFTAITIASGKITAKGFNGGFKDRDANAAAVLGGFATGILSGLVAIGYVALAIQILLAPEWYAIKTLIGR